MIRHPRRTFLALGLLLGCVPLRAQLADTLPLLQRVEHAPSGLERLDGLEKLAWAWLFSPRSLAYIEQAEPLAHALRQAPDVRTRREAAHLHGMLLYTKGYYHKFRREMPQALACFRQARAWHQMEHDTMRMANADDGIGVCLMAVGMPRAARTHFESELALIRSTRNPIKQNMARAQLHLAEALMRSGDPAGARAMVAQVDTGIPEVHAFALMAAAQMDLIARDTAEGLAHMERALTTVQHSRNTWDALPVLEPYARLRAQAGDHAASLLLANRCMELAERTADEGALCGCRILAGDALLRTGDARGAERAFLTALRRAEHWGYTGLSREIGDEGSVVHALGRLTDLYGAQGRLPEALAMSRAFAAAKDTVHAIEARDALLAHELELAQLADSAAESQRIERATTTIRSDLVRERGKRNMALLIGSGLLLLGAGVTLVLVRARKKDRMVAAQDRELARQERIIQEYRIREQLGQDMHDDLGAGLTALKLRSELIGTMPMAPGDRQELGQLATMAGDLIASLRQIIWALDAEKGSLADLVSYIGNHVRTYGGENGLAVELATTGPWPGLQLSPEQRRNLFLVVKEALHNVVKHARARNVRLAMHMDGPMLYIAFSDDGVGLPPEGERTAGNGLRNMQRRIEAFGGRFHLEKAVPRGTSVHACLPLGEQ